MNRHRRAATLLVYGILLPVCVTGCGGGCDGCRGAAAQARAAAEEARRKAAEGHARATEQARAAAASAKAAAARLKVPERYESAANLRRLGDAMLSYHAPHGQFPPAASRAPDGRPLLSWRVHILPHLGEEALYREFHLDEPWNSPHNAALLPRMPRVYAAPGGTTAASGPTTLPATRPTTTPVTLPASGTVTFYKVFTGPGTVFEEGGTVALKSVADGASQTLLIVEAGEPVPWTKPDDLPYAPDRPLPPLGFFGGHVFAVSCGGTLLSFVGPADLYERELRAAVTRNGGERSPSGGSSGWDD